MNHVLIVGAGVAGPVLAVALQRAGIGASIFERDPEHAGQRGSWLNFQANGMDALSAIDASSAIEEIGFPVDTMSFINGRGKSLGRMPMAFRRADGLTSRMMPRATLYSRLSELARSRGVSVSHGKLLVEAREMPGGGVEARFADGTVATGDILVGCDGIHSRVRNIIDPRATPPRYVPVLNVGGYIPRFPVDAPAADFRMQFGTRCFFGWLATPDGGVVWFANPPMAREPERGVLSSMTDSQWRQWLHQLMDGDAGPAHSIIDAAEGPLLGWATYDLPVVKRWHNGRNLIVIGDAAHATSPAAGQGASMALEDAVILAQCLRDAPAPSAAFRAFEAMRRERVEKIVKLGHRSSNAKAAGPVGRVIRDWMLPFFFRRAERDGGRSMMWLQGHHIDFEARVIPAESGRVSAVGLDSAA